MKRPREPKQINFWLAILSDADKTKDFLDRCGHSARKELILAIRFKKWQEIQKRKSRQEEVYA